ncbi:MAG: acetate/propionate family kinase [Hyphomicrobiaceae bacterium]
MSDTILVINAGSSSIKFELFAVAGDAQLDRRLRGQIEGIGSRPRLFARDGEGKVLVDEVSASARVPDVPAAIERLQAWIKEYGRGRPPTAVGHRIVHGGPLYDRPVRISAEVIRNLQGFVPLAPLHQPNNLAPVEAIHRRRPEVLQVACFDTAFHRRHGELADRYAIPEKLYQDGVRRYGFHGLSYEYIAQTLPTLAPNIAEGRVVVAHLGSGASMCALHGRSSIDSTMGFTALDGLPMGTRPGQLDPGVVLYLHQRGMSTEAVQNLLYKECGLKGLSGISNDVRDLLASADPRARLAIDYFVYRIAKELGALACALGGLDALIFTAGIGENSPAVRKAVLQRIAWLGFELDEAANEANRTAISKPASRRLALVIPTNEELMIARHTLGLLRTPT